MVIPWAMENIEKILQNILRNIVYNLLQKGNLFRVAFLDKTTFFLWFL
jgi:hypothetical protein